MAGILFLTELVGLKVFDIKGRAIGRVRDAALVPLIDPKRIDRFLIGGGEAWLTIRHDQVQSISLNGIELADELLTPYHSDEYMLRIVRDLLDQQIIDHEGRKVVRVTDITFRLVREGGRDTLHIEEVDIGLRSIVRRLVQGVIPPRWTRKLQGPIAPHSISWARCSILESDPMRRLRLNISNKLLEEMHPADLADIVEELGPEDREAIIATLDSEVAAEALSEVEPETRASILEALETEKAAEIVEEMSPDEAADVLNELEDETAGEILEEMQAEPKDDVRELLDYRADTAGGLMTTEYVALREEATVADALEALRANEDILETLNTFFLIDAEGRLRSTVPLARLLLQDAQTPLLSLSSGRPLSVAATESQKRVAELFDRYNLLCLAVRDEEGALAGVITADDIISLLREE